MKETVLRADPVHKTLADVESGKGTVNKVTISGEKR